MPNGQLPEVQPREDPTLLVHHNPVLFIEPMSEYPTLCKTKDVAGLLNMHCHQILESWTMQVQMHNLFEIQEDPKESSNAFSKCFLDQLDLTEE